MECNCKADETRAQELEPEGWESSGKKFWRKKCSGKLYEVTERLRSPVFEEEKVEELYGEILMSAKAPKKEEKGYEYPVMGHVVGLDGKIQGERKRFATHGWILEISVETGLFQQKDKSKRKLPTIT